MSIVGPVFEQPNFNAVMKALLQPLVDQQNVTNSIPNLYNLDVAVGSQLDTVGKWIGPTRFVEVPITGLFFSFDIAGLGFDQGQWAPTTGGDTTLVALGDDEYRLLLYAAVAANHWDGTVPGGEAVLNDFWTSLGYKEYIIDGMDMTVSFLLVGPVPNAITAALYKNGYLDVIAAGVGVNAHYFVEGSGGIPFTPLFGFDVESAFIAGFDQGAWASETFSIAPQLTLHGAIVEGIDRIAAQSYIPVILSGAITERSDHASAVNTAATMSGAIVESHDLVSAQGSHISSGSAAIVESRDVSNASGAPSVAGVATIVEHVDTVSATATV